MFPVNHLLGNDLAPLPESLPPNPDVYVPLPPNHSSHDFQCQQNSLFPISDPFIPQYIDDQLGLPDLMGEGPRMDQVGSGPGLGSFGPMQLGPSYIGGGNEGRVGLLHPSPPAYPNVGAPFQIGPSNDIPMDQVAADDARQKAAEKARKRQQRLMRNRESATRSRERQKAYLLELKSEVQQLRAENEGLKKEIVDLKTILNKESGNTEEGLEGSFPAPV